jgi:hypothetical protein
MRTANNRYALSIGVAAALLAGCGGSQPMTNAPSTAVQPATHSTERSLQGYYLTNFTVDAGSGVPGSLCIRFKPSGSWSSSSFNGTYLISGKELFASGVWTPSPPVYLGLIGSFNAKQGTGKFIVSGEGGYASGGGTFTMKREQNKTCT